MENLLLTDSVDSIVSNFSLKSDSTEDILNLLKIANLNTLHKLIEIINKLKNFNLEVLLDFSNTNNRKDRQIITEVIFSLSLSKNEIFIKNINNVIENVFKLRIRDIDLYIRLSSLNFGINYILNNKILNDDVFNALFISLNDKNDKVKITLLKGILSILENIKINYNLLKIYKKSFIEILKFDKNNNNKNESLKLLIYFFNNNFITENEILQIFKYKINIKNNNKTKSLFKALFKKILKEKDFNKLHDVYKKTENTEIFKFYKIKNLNLFVKEMKEFIIKNSNCCENSYFCLFDIINVLVLNNKNFNINLINDLLETCKDNFFNISKILEILINLNHFTEYPEETEKILKKIFKNFIKENKENEENKEKKLFVKNNISSLSFNNLSKNFSFINLIKNNNKSSFEIFYDNFITNFIILLKKLEKNFKIVNFYIDKLKFLYSNEIIKYFDISNDNYNNIVFLCYSSLWKIKNSEFNLIKEIFNEKIFLLNINKEELCEISNFFIFVYEKYKNLENNENFISNYKEIEIFNLKDCFKYILNVIYILIEKNVDLFDCEDSIVFFFKIFNLNLLNDYSYKFYKIKKLSLLKCFISECKNIKNLFLGFFIENEFIYSKNENIEICKSLANKINKNDDDRFLFLKIKEILLNKYNSYLVNNILILFIPLLKMNEAIVLEAMSKEGKFKNLLLKKCKAKNIKEINI